MKKVFKLTESELRNYIVEAVKKHLDEAVDSLPAKTVRNEEEALGQYDYVGPMESDGCRIVTTDDGGSYNLINKNGKPVFYSFFDDISPVGKDGYRDIQYEMCRYHVKFKDGKVVDKGDFDDIDAY